MEKVTNTKEAETALKMVFWNAHGLGGVKADNWKYLREFDVIRLTETFSIKKRENRVRSTLKNNKILMAGAITEHGKQGRPKCGVILAFKSQTVEEIDEREDLVLQEIIGSKFG